MFLIKLDKITYSFFLQSIGYFVDQLMLHIKVVKK